MEVAKALRALSRSWGLVITVTVTLGLGVGANAAVFTVLDPIFFQAPSGVTDPGAMRRLYAVNLSKQLPGGRRVSPYLNARDLVDLTDATRGITDLLDPQLRPWRVAATLFFLLGVLGLGAASAGIYGLVAYDVTQRSRELGVRIALGATSASILRLVVGSGLRVVLIGATAGTVAAVIAGRAVASLLFATSPYDPVALLGTALTLAVAATLASLVPAWRAIRVDPITVLSSE